MTWHSVSPCLKHPAEGPLSDVPHVFDVVAWILQRQQLGVEQQWQALVHGVWVQSVQQQLGREGSKSGGLYGPAEDKQHKVRNGEKLVAH